MFLPCFLFVFVPSIEEFFDKKTRQPRYLIGVAPSVIDQVHYKSTM